MSSSKENADYFPTYPVDDLESITERTPLRKVEAFTIDRSRLCRGGLVRGDCACSLGQYLQACGMPTDEIANPDRAYPTLAGFLDGYEKVERVWWANDSGSRPSESMIVGTFAAAGVSCSFTGDYRPDFVS